MKKVEASPDARHRIRRLILLDKEMLYACQQRRSNDLLHWQNTRTDFGYRTVGSHVLQMQQYHPVCILLEAAQRVNTAFAAQ